MVGRRFARVVSSVSVFVALLGAVPLMQPSAALAADSATPPRWIGFYQPGTPQSLGPITAMEAKLGVHIGVTNYFRSIEQKFVASEVDNAASHGTIPLITLEFCADNDSGNLDQPTYRLARITRGDLDATLIRWADAARDSGHEIWVRPFHEMNGAWYPWAGTQNGNVPSDFVPAWRHVHDIFAREGATNVKFVWCVNAESHPGTSANSIDKYYPGDAYVDYLAVDGYNWSTTLPEVKWRTFSSLFSGPYATLCSLSETKPIFICETASVSQGGNKPAWIADMFRTIPTSFPRVVGVGWFNAQEGSRDWPVDTSSASVQSFRLGVANGTYAPGLQLAKVRTAVSVKSSAKSTRRKRRITLSGVLTPGQYHDRLRVNVSIPRHRGSHRNVYTNGSAGWSMRYSLSYRGTYYFRVTYAGDGTRFAGSSKTIKVVVK